MYPSASGSSASSKKSIDEDKNLYLDRPMKGKTQEQLKRHSLEQNIEKKPIERSLYILTRPNNADLNMEDDVNLSARFDVKLFEDLYLNGEDTQKISVVHSLPHLVTVDSTAVYTRIIPKIKQDLPSASCEFQLATSATYMTLLQKYANPSVLESVIQGIGSKDPNVSQAWSQTLFACLGNIPETMVQETVLPLAKNKFQPNAPVQAKIFCGRLMGEICANVKFRAINVKRDILPIVIGLCQDGNPDVRLQICTYLPKVAKVLGNEAEKTNLLSCIVELARDENLNVRATSVVAISAMMQILSQDTNKNTLMPLVKTLCEKTEESSLSALILSGELGVLLTEMPKPTEDDVMFFVRIYQKLSQKGKQASSVKANASIDVVIRQRCASNFLVFLQLVKHMVPAQVADLYTAFREHTIDPCYLVRKSAAAILADVAQILASDNKMMKNEIVRMLRDDAVEVLEEILPTIGTLLCSLSISGVLTNEDASQTTVEIGKALIKCQNELKKRYNWRLSVTFMKQMEVLPICMPANYIHTNFTPAMFDKLVNGKAKPIKIQAARTLIVFMRFNFAVNQNKWIRESIIRQTAQAKSCFNRQLYFYVCEAVLDVYSEKFFKQFFLDPCLSLATDKIQNVRWKFINFSSRLKGMVTLAKDAPTKQLIMDAITKLEATEKAKVVLELIRIKKRELPKYLPEMLRQEETRVREEQTTIIKRLEDDVGNAGGDVKPGGPGLNKRLLENHFYVDAGIKLATVFGIDNELHHNKDTLDAADFIEIESGNITDDAKVNLRKMHSKLSTALEISTPGLPRNKRYSSIISASCLDISRNNDKMLQKRRSLNLQHCCDSKIPVAHRLKAKTPSLDLPFTKEENAKNKDISNNLYNSTFIPHSSLISTFRGKPGPPVGKPVSTPSSLKAPNIGPKPPDSVAPKSVAISARPSTAMTPSSSGGPSQQSSIAPKPPAAAGPPKPAGVKPAPPKAPLPAGPSRKK